MRVRDDLVDVQLPEGAPERLRRAWEHEHAEALGREALVEGRPIESGRWRGSRLERPDPYLRLRYEHLFANDWKPFNPFFMMNRCGHGHEYQPWLQSDGWWLLVPVVGEA